MLRKLVVALVLIALLAACAPTRPAPNPPDYWPTDGWRTTSPEEQGMDSETLARMVEHVAHEGLDLHSLLVIRNGYLVTELYPHPYSAGQPHWVMSVTKSVIGTLVGIAIERGFIKDVKQTLGSLLPMEDLAGLDEAKKAITVEDVLTQRSGLDCPFESTGQPGGAEGQTWLQAALDQQLSSKPGTKFNYCTNATHVLSAVLQKATGMTAREFANRVLFAPLGIGPISQALWPSDPQGVTIGGYGLSLTPTEMAKLAYLFLNQGRWDGQQVVPAEWVATSTNTHVDRGSDKGYGYLWWVDPKGEWYAALGRGGQHVFVYPTENLVVAFTADLLTNPQGDLPPLQELLDSYILPAVKSDGPLPASPQGQAHLKSAMEALAHPQAVDPAPLPDLAREISGETYALEDNAFGWHTISLTFKQGAAEGTVTLDGQRVVKVGLDGLYRAYGAEDPTFPQAVRGHWEGPDTFVVEDLYLGQTMQFTFRIQFSGDTVHLTALERDSGTTLEAQGSLSPVGP
jgi:CubicO group peptidase (beta-lactamase class C family)